MAEYNSHRINLTTPNSRIELFMNDECVGQIDIGLNVKVTMHKPHISNKRPSTTKRGAQKEIDMAQGIFELEMEELLWNRKMLMDHIGYKGYRDIDKFVAYLTSNKYVTVEITIYIGFQHFVFKVVMLHLLFSNFKPVHMPRTCVDRYGSVVQRSAITNFARLRPCRPRQLSPWGAARVGR